MQAELCKTLSFPHYLAHPNYGSSDLRAFRRGPPAMVPWQRANRTAGTDAMRLGRAAHCILLEPSTWADNFALKPEGMEFRSKENKEIRDKWLADGLTIITQAQLQAAQAAADAIGKKLETAGVRIGNAEHSILWTCGESGLPCKTRPDFYDDHAAYDIKLSVMAEQSARQMAKHAYEMGWMHQGAIHRAGLRACGVQCDVARLVIAAPSPPHDCRVWLLEISEDDLDFLELENMGARRGMMDCHRLGVWPGSPDVWTRLELPAYASIDDEDLHGATVDTSNPLLSDMPGAQ